MMRYVLILLISFSQGLLAGVINSDARHFIKTGSISRFLWAPEHYRSSFRYDVLYYIPESVKDEVNVKALIFMHGGGKSTRTREGSLKTAINYLSPRLMRLADELKTIVIVPSASGLNWGGHTVGVIKDLTTVVRKELAVDHNNIGLAGHSMGGMGIGRSFPFLADEFAYFVPMSSGIDEKYMLVENLNKVFNVPYVHLQGVNDHFEVFVERGKEQLRRTKALEAKYGEKSKLEVIFYQGDHDYNYNLLKKTIARLQASPRNIYQRKLYGTLLYDDNFYSENGITFHRKSIGRYFWIEVLEGGARSERLDFLAAVSNNVISINFLEKPQSIRKVRVYLSSKMLSPDRPVELIVNGKHLFTKTLAEKNLKDPVDEGFAFDDFINITFN